ncbi:MAG: hypothetical protein ACLPY1_09440 [Terracidiphilus sp.]
MYIAVEFFSVSQNGHMYPARISQPSDSDPASGSSFPPHLLVVFAPGASRPKDSSLIKSLKKVFTQGWLVSVSRSDGSFTAYCAATTLGQALAATAASTLSGEHTEWATQQAVANLEGFPGRKVLLLDVKGDHGKTVPEPLSLAAMARPQSYIVDGGAVKMVYRDESWDAYTRGPSPWGGSYYRKRERFVDKDGIHEVKLSSAIKDILKDARHNPRN